MKLERGDYIHIKRNIPTSKIKYQVIVRKIKEIIGDKVLCDDNIIYHKMKIIMTDETP